MALGRIWLAVPVLLFAAVIYWLVAGNPHNIGTVRYSDHVVGDGPRMLEQSCRHQLEGVISKRIGSHYAGRRTRD